MRRVERDHVCKSGARKHLVFAEGRVKPLALPADWPGEIPRLGDSISIEASEGDIMCFPLHRQMAITPKENVGGAPELVWTDVQRLREGMKDILAVLASGNIEVTADNVRGQLFALVPAPGGGSCAHEWVKTNCKFCGADKRAISAPFTALSSVKVIESERGPGKKSTDKEHNHGRWISTWHLTAEAKRMSDEVPPERRLDFLLAMAEERLAAKKAEDTASQADEEDEDPQNLEM